jgi:CIC family chloride channel protein
MILCCVIYLLRAAGNIYRPRFIIFLHAAPCTLKGLFSKVKNVYTKWIVGGILLGLVIYSSPLYGEGYGTLNALLNGNPDELTYGSIFYGFGDNLIIMILFLLLILLFKVAATAITNGSGGVGGYICPNPVYGRYLGYLVAKVLNIFSFINVSERNLPW